MPKLISKKDIENTLEFFSKNQYYLQINTLIELGISSGLRAEELYQLKPDDICLDDRIVRVNHNPMRGQTTKTKKSRISFFTNDTKKALTEYLT